jgi:hypothetical protein
MLAVEKSLRRISGHQDIEKLYRRPVSTKFMTAAIKKNPLR